MYIVYVYLRIELRNMFITSYVCIAIYAPHYTHKRVRTAHKRISMLWLTHSMYYVLYIEYQRILFGCGIKNQTNSINKLFLVEPHIRYLVVRNKCGNLVFLQLLHNWSFCEIVQNAGAHDILKLMFKYLEEDIYRFCWTRWWLTVELIFIVH